MRKFVTWAKRGLFDAVFLRRAEVWNRLSSPVSLANCLG